MKTNIHILAILLAFVLISSCKKEDPIIPNEEEVITTLKYTLTPVGGGTAVTMTFQDLDGDGGNAPTITGGILVANTTYNGSLELLNETKTPADDITAEIQAEGDEHQFFFSSTVAGLGLAYNDQDGNGNPIGLKSTVTTTTAGYGQVKITLRHEPNKTAAGVASGDITNAGGETDIEVTFDVDVQ